MAPVLHMDVLDAVGRAELGEVRLLGRREELLEDRVELGHRQVLEDPAAPVVDEDHRQASPELRRDEEAVGVMEERQVAREEH